MSDFAIYATATGKILYTHSSLSDPADLPDGMAAVAIPDGIDVGFSTHVIVDGAFADYVPTLDDTKRVKSQLVGQYFNSLFMSSGGFTYSGTLYQIDAGSQAAITAMGADADRSLRDPATFPWDVDFVFIAADNSRVAMDAATMAAFSQAIANYVRTCRYRVRDLKDAVAAAVDQAALDAIEVTSGYPSSSS